MKGRDEGERRRKGGKKGRGAGSRILTITEINNGLPGGINLSCYNRS